MQWPFKTTISFAAPDGKVVRVHYAVSAISASEAKIELEQRLSGEEIFGYVVEEVVAATGQEAFQLKLPEKCVQLLG
jgi:putative alpha-1,2-mannosidase